MKNQFTRAACFLLGLAVLLQGFGWLYRPRNNNASGGTLLEHAKGYLSEPADSIDVFFVGSSEFYRGVCPMRIWDESGITTYDMSTSSQRLYQTAFYVRQILETHHPKLIVLDAYALIRRDEADPSLFYGLCDVFPLLDYHGNWKLFGPQELMSPVAYTNHVAAKGFRPKSRAAKANTRRFMRKTAKSAPFGWINRWHMRSIETMCQKAGVELLIVAAPSTINWNYSRHNAMQAYADEKGIPFLDLNVVVDEVGIDPATDYLDGGDHLNGPGAKKVSIYLAHYLEEHYGLPDHRKDPAYASWQEDYDTIYDYEKK